MKTDFLDQAKVNGLLLQTDEYVRHEYLSVLSNASPQELDGDKKNIVQLMHLTSFSYSSEDNITQKICSVYGAIEQQGVTAALILDGRKDRIDLYLGAYTQTDANIASGYKAFISSFNGIFPGSKYINVKNKLCDSLLEDIFNPTVKTAVAAVSAFPLKDDGKHLSYPGLEVLVDGMRNRPFTMVLLAESINPVELVQMRHGFESLYTQIAPLQKQDVSVSSSRTDTLGVNFSKSIADSLSVSSGISKSHTDTFGTNQSVQTGPDNEAQRKNQASNQLIGTAVAAASVLAMGPEGIAIRQGANILQSLFYGQTLSNLLNSTQTVTGQDPELDRQSKTEGSHEDHSDSLQKQVNRTAGQTITGSEGSSESLGVTSGQTTQISYVNKSVGCLLERIENTIQEINRLESEGAFRAATYFIAGDEETAIAAASIYRSIVTAGMKTHVNSPVYHWRGDKGKSILQKIKKGVHPTFSFEQHPQFPYISPAQLVGLSDLPYYLTFPQKSVLGLDVSEHASFSRDVQLRNDCDDIVEREIQIGNIYHMGKEIKSAPVVLDVNKLTAHLFVSGATGSGKSNFCYQLLDSLLKADVKALIVEPAKGEYAKVFGGRSNFKVFGTNLRQAPPLRINPFAFPEGVSAPEHIERLLAIFNAAWPMYSAMPAIMKEALEEIYARKGFDPIMGDLPDGGSFPTFADLLEVLPQVIKHSEYSAEVQGNYIGALVTRVKSLTNGVYTIIFSEDELGDSVLFDENVIVDISRIGSEETKALIMGFLVTRLSEYRSCSGKMNSELNHVTLLEEAHHLLGKTAASKGQDVGNMTGASVQMLSNAIREMRTYGDGFIIADQSPSIMDQSVMANTQTKVFFMLPRKEDRTLASDSMSLNESQSNEITKLSKGIAVIFQNEWSSAVLCKINYFSPDNYKPYLYKAQPEKETKELLTEAIRIINEDSVFSNHDKHAETARIDKSVDFGNTGYGLGIKRKLVLNILENKEHYIGLDAKNLKDLYCSLLGMDRIFYRYSKEKNIINWSTCIENEICRLTILSPEESEFIVRIYLLAKSKEDNQYHKLYVDYLSLKASGTYD